METAASAGAKKSTRSRSKGRSVASGKRQEVERADNLVDAKEGKQATKLRLSVELAPRYADILDWMKEESGSSSMVDVIRTALELYEDKLLERARERRAHGISAR